MQREKKRENRRGDPFHPVSFCSDLFPLKFPVQHRREPADNEPMPRFFGDTAFFFKKTGKKLRCKIVKKKKDSILYWQMVFNNAVAKRQTRPGKT